MGRELTKLVLFDNSDKFTPIWRAGTTIDRTPYSYGVGDWQRAFDLINIVSDAADGPIDVQVWGHGNDGAVFIDGRRLSIPLLAKHCPGRINSWWSRSCETIKGVVGRNFAREFVSQLDAVYIGHEVITNWPNPLWQGKCAALQPGQEVWWTQPGEKLKGCITTRMKPPRHAYRWGSKYDIGVSHV